jgi:hypothetical protein
MKKLLILFGILDIVTLILKYQIIPGLASDWTYFPIIVIGNILVCLLLIFSAYFLIRQHKIGLWLTYIQFPLRLLFVTLSFNFLFVMNSFQQGELGFKIFVVTVMGLEIVRLIITIVIHRKYFRQTTIPTFNQE